MEKDYETTFKVATEAPLDPVLKMVISTVEGIPTGNGPSSDTGKFQLIRINWIQKMKVYLTFGLIYY